MRTMWRAWGLSAVIGASLVLTSGALPAREGPVVHVNAVVKDGSVLLEARADGPFDYTAYRPSGNLYVLDLNGVSAGDAGGVRVVDSTLVKSYRVVTADSQEKHVVRLEILVDEAVEPRLDRKGSQDLTVLISRNVSSHIAPGSGVGASPATKAVSGATLGAIQQVSLSDSDGQTQIIVLGSRHLDYRVMRLQNPDRLVLDFAGAHLGTPTKHIASNLDPVREIRLAQFAPEVSRVVIDLREPARYEINAKGNGVTIAFPASAPVNGAVKAPAAETSSGLITTKSSTPQSAAAETSVSNIPAPAAVLPVALTQTSAALATPASPNPPQGSSVSPQVVGQVAGATVNARNEASAETGGPSTSTSAPATSQPVATAGAGSYAAQAPAATASNRYSGEPISVNLKDVDLRDFFRLIHEISGLNVVVDPNVKGTLTIVLDDVPWDQALDIVLRNNDLDKQLDGNVLRVATKETVKKEAEEARDLAKAQAEAAEVVTTTRVLSYAKAADLVVPLKKFISARGDILADARSNTLIVRDIPATLPVLDNLIRQLDRKSQQVEIEARVVAANRSYDREIGTQLGLATGNVKRSAILGGSTQVGTSPIIRNFPALPVPPILVSGAGSTTPAPTSGSLPLLTNLAASAPTSGISYAFSSANFALDMIISALEEKAAGKLLSKPKLVTQNNQKATIKQGTKIPVQTIINNTISVQFVDAVLELDVTPQITADGTIHMDVTVENDAIDNSIPRVQGIPAIDTQSDETSVTVNDGATIVIGGVIISSQRTDVQQVPLFGSLPVVGNLFKHTTVDSTAQELLFFLTPRILPD
jgi:type IV pilus secretin PilQ/predicted competence protein